MNQKICITGKRGKKYEYEVLDFIRIQNCQYVILADQKGEAVILKIDDASSF